MRLLNLTSKLHQLVNLVKGRCAIKAVGGLKTLAQACEIVDAGATLIGTSEGPSLMHALRHGQQ